MMPFPLESVRPYTGIFSLSSISSWVRAENLGLDGPSPSSPPPPPDGECFRLPQNPPIPPPLRPNSGDGAEVLPVAWSRLHCDSLITRAKHKSKQLFIVFAGRPSPIMPLIVLSFVRLEESGRSRNEEHAVIALSAFRTSGSNPARTQVSRTSSGRVSPTNSFSPARAGSC